MKLGRCPTCHATLHLDATVRNIHTKLQSGETVKPLTNHNYLKQVLTGLKEQFNHPVNGSKKAANTGNAQIKQYHQLSDAENERLRLEQFAQFRQPNQEEQL